MLQYVILAPIQDKTMISWHVHVNFHVKSFIFPIGPHLIGTKCEISLSPACLQSSPQEISVIGTTNGAAKMSLLTVWTKTTATLPLTA